MRERIFMERVEGKTVKIFYNMKATSFIPHPTPLSTSSALLFYLQALQLHKNE